MNRDWPTKPRAGRTSTSRPASRASSARVSRTTSAETGHPLAHSLARQDALARSFRRSLALGLAIALGLHALLALALVWLAAQRAPREESVIPIAWIFEESAQGEGGAPRAEPPPPPTPPPAALRRPSRAAPPPPRPAPAPARAPRTVEPAPAATPNGIGEGAAQAREAAPVAPANDPGRIYAEGEVDAVAVPVGRIAPRYPRRMQQLGREGTVELDVIVEPDGRVRDTSVRRSAGADFDAATREAVAQQRFRPAQRGGEAVASQVTFRYRFTLE